MLLESALTLTWSPARRVAPLLMLVETSARAKASILEPMLSEITPPPYEPAVATAFLPANGASVLVLKLCADRKETSPDWLSTTAPFTAYVRIVGCTVVLESDLRPAATPPEIA